MWREEDDLYRTSTTRTAAVVLFSAAVLLLPRTAPISWWAVGPAVAFLAGPDAGYITGATLNVDGGQSA